MEVNVNNRYVFLLVSLLFLSACSAPVHKDFLQNLTQSQKTDGTRSRVVTSLVYSEKEKVLLVGHESGSIEIWDATKAKSVREIKAHDYRANLLSFSADGRAFFSSSYFEDNTKQPQSSLRVRPLFIAQCKTFSAMFMVMLSLS